MSTPESATPSTPRAARICVVGSTNMDMNSYVTRLPRRGETIHGLRFQISYGGKGANQAVMAARLGAQVRMVTKVGDDVFGQDARQNLARHGIDTETVLVTDQAFTGVAAITIDQEGTNTIIVTPGANHLLTSEDVEAARPAIVQAQVLVCQLEIPLESTLAALRMAREAGVLTLFNPAPAPTEPLPDEAYALSDLLCPNEIEVANLAGVEVESPEEAEAAARVLLERGAGQVIVTLGERGSLLVTREKSVLIPATPAQAVDTTGAGDAFIGSVATFLAWGLPLEEAMRRANRVAAHSVQKPGAQASFPTAAELPAELLA